MGHITAESKLDFIKQLNAQLAQHVPSNQLSSLTEFTRQYFSIIGMDDIRRMDMDDVVGSTLSMWQFTDKVKPNQPKIEVFNPVYEQNGWHSSHTVIRIAQQDMPFLVDSVRLHLNERNLTIHYLQNMVFNSHRSKDHERVYTGGVGAAYKEAALHIEIDRLESAADLDQLIDDLRAVLTDVERVVSDFKPMSTKVEEIIKSLESAPEHPDTAEMKAFLQWLLSNNFTFLGFEELSIEQDGDSTRINCLPDSRFGLLRPEHDGGLSQEELEPMLGCDTLASKDALTFSKAAVRSTVHRRAYPDFVAVKRYDDNGQIVSEARIMGLYTSPVYTESPRNIPWLRRKVAAVVDESGLERGSHLGKELTQVLEVFPRDELFQMPQDQLFDTAMSILQIQERHQVRVFLREGINGIFVSALVYVPRDMYSTSLRIRMQNILTERLKAIDTSFTTYFSESVLARVHFIFRLNPGQKLDINHEHLTKQLIQAASSWEEHLLEAVLEAKGEALGNRLLTTYSDGFSPGYRDMFSPRTAVVDMDHCEQLSELSPLGLSFYKGLDDVDNQMRFKVYHLGCPLPLSEQIPIFENLGLRVIGEYPYIISKDSGEEIWIHDFSMEASAGMGRVDVQKVNKIFTESFRKIWYEDADNDAFNRLVLSAQMDWRKVAIFRAYARYMKQIRFGFSQAYIAETLCSNINITRLLYDLFRVRFEPALDMDMESRATRQQELEEEINQALEEVSALSQDRVLRRYLDIIKATLRTNFYQLDSQGGAKSYISLKFSPRDIPDIPKPRPMFEIFVYSPRVEGVHLRGGKVARGGLRWSDRVEDFRTEVLGLVKAQQVKNAVIVPVGAKGGFVPKRLPSGDREAILAEGIGCYQIFIRGLLDITDNLVEGEVVHPASVLFHDEDDPYLVVAADKGTATFSDIANGIAEEYGFWLGDAFASGGSVGYDHKKMGITAKGGWVSVQRHFRERGINVQQDTVTVVGIGDMAGDVFGNGMLLSERLALVAAFNHMHIFIDPNPQDVQACFNERQRLFNLPRSTWTDYDRKLISAGGGVFSRAAKSIRITPEMKARFAIDANQLTPTDLINALLKAPVDLVWNGGIGTYVKSSSETHSDVGDKANDTLRVNGNQLRCKVFGEGGNLGLSQLGRVEYAGQQSGQINTDFIDNAAGVDCSDHEVNIKVLLNGIVAAGDMTRKQRDQLLEEMTDDISDLVLQNNYRQTLALSIAESHAADSVDQYRRFMTYLEQQGKLDRVIEFLPDNDSLSERISQSKGLTRPELCTLISYAKAGMKEELLASSVPDDDYMALELYTAFPQRLKEHYHIQLMGHRLRREIVSTQVVNHMVNMMGICFAHQLQQSTGATSPEIATAFVVARDVFDIENYWQQIESLDYAVKSDVQYQMMDELIRLMRRACRWFIRIKRGSMVASECINHYAPVARRFADNLEAFMSPGLKVRWEQRVEELVEQQVPEELARFVAAARFMFYSLSIGDAVTETGQPLESVAHAFFTMGEHLDLHWFSQELAGLHTQNHWQSMARDSIRDELTWQQRALAVSLLACEGESVQERLECWQQNKEAQINRWRELLSELRSSGSHELAMFTVANRELMELAKVN